MTNFRVGDIVVRSHDIGRIAAVMPEFRDGEDFYRIVPLDDDTLTIYLPISRADQLLRPVMTRAQAEQLIDDIPNVPSREVSGRNIETVYNDLIRSGSHRDIISLIKTSYMRCQAKIAAGQPRNDRDKAYLRRAESLLYNEFALALGYASVDDVRARIVSRFRATA